MTPTVASLRDLALLELSYGKSASEVLAKFINRAAQECVTLSREFPDFNPRLLHQDIALVVAEDIAAEIEKRFGIAPLDNIMRSVISLDGYFGDTNAVDSETRNVGGHHPMVSFGSNIRLAECLKPEAVVAILSSLAKLNHSDMPVVRRAFRHGGVLSGRPCSVQVSNVPNHIDLAILEVDAGLSLDGKALSLRLPDSQLLEEITAA